MIDYIAHQVDKYQYFLTFFATISLIMLIISIFIIPLVLKKMPTDHFINPQYHQIKLNNFMQIIKFVIKNVIGLLLIVVGIIMLFTPGQGIISILMGLFLMHFKGKYQLEKRIIQNDATFKILNWIRSKNHQPPFQR